MWSYEGIPSLSGMQSWILNAVQRLYNVKKGIKHKLRVS